MPRQKQRGVPEGIKQMSELPGCLAWVYSVVLAISMQLKASMHSPRCSSGLLNSTACPDLR